MNRIYRLVFNRALGVMQVASELAQSHPGQAGGGDGRPVGVVSSLRFALWLALAWVSVVVPVDAQQAGSLGRIISDHQAPQDQRPVVVAAPNGTPLVNISTPTAGGVSRNAYSQFDVGRQGVILNNARVQTQTQLGGWVDGNPYLATGTAKVILNEVNSANPSYLNGYIEVGGDRAQVIIANPAGIQVNGGGFINANQATLTTGKPVFAGGSLDYYRVQGGVIGIDGDGLDASATDYTQLIARSLQVNAGLWAQHLAVTTGTNTVNAASGAIQSTQAATGPAPALAIDVSQLGGMYAGKISLMGTEHGVGVRNAGSIGAQAGELVVTSAGRLENTGALQSQSNTRVQAADGVRNAGTLSAGRELQVNTGKDLDNGGGTLNAQRLALKAASLRNRDGTIEQTGIQGLALQSDRLSNRDGGRIGLMDVSDAGNPGTDPGTPGTPDGGSAGSVHPGSNPGGGGTGPAPTPTPAPVLADGVLNIAGALNNDGGRIIAGGGVDLSSTQGLDNAGGQMGLRNLTLDSGRLSNEDGKLVIAGSAYLHAQHIGNDGGELTVAGPLSLQVTRFSNRAGRFQQADDSASTWQIAGLLDNSGGSLASNAAALSIDAGRLVNADGRIEHAGTQGLAINTGALQGAGGTIASAGAASMNAGDIDHRGATWSATQTTLNAQSLDNRGGTLISTGDGRNTLQVQGWLDNSAGGTIASNGDVDIRAGSLGNAAGTIQQAGEGTLLISTGELSGAGGVIASNGGLQVQGSMLDLSGATTSAKRINLQGSGLNHAGGTLSASGEDDLQLRIDGALDNSAGTIAGNGALQLSTQSLNNQGGQVIAAGTGASTLAVAQTLDNRAGTLAMQGDIALSAQTFDNSGGNLQQAGQGTARIEVGHLQGAGGTIASNGYLHITARDEVNLQAGDTRAQRVSISATDLGTANGQLIATGEQVMRLKVGNALDNRGGTLAGNGHLVLDAASLDNRQGTISLAGEEASSLQLTGTLDNSEGSLISNGRALTLDSARLINQAGNIQHAGDERLNIRTGNLDGNQGVIASAGALSLQAADIAHRNATLNAAQVTLNARNLDNSGGQLVASMDKASTLTVANKLINQQGTIASNGALSLRATTLNNVNGNVQQASDSSLDIDVQTLAGNRGKLLSNGLLTITGQQVDLSEGTTSAEHLRISSTHLNNADGQLTATGSGELTLTVTDTLDNQRGSIAGNGTLAVQAASINNRQGRMQSAGAGNNTLTVSGQFNNNAGSVLTAGNTVVRAANLDNRDGSVQSAGQAGLQVHIDEALDNRQGLLAGGGDTDISALSIDNQRGTLASVNGALSVTGQLNNAQGTLQSGQRLSLTSDGLNNVDGRIMGGQTYLNAGRGVLDNRGGTLASSQGEMNIRSGRIDNTEGLLQSTGNLSVDSNGQLLDNRQGGNIISGGSTTLRSGVLNNQGGLVFSQGDADVQASDIDNTQDGQLSSAADLSVRGSQLANTGGTVQAGGDATLSMRDTLDNQAGFIAAGQTLKVSASTVDNRDTLDSNNAALGLQGDQVDITSTSLDNRKGNIGSDQRTRLSVTNALQNQQGRVSSGGEVEVTAKTIGNTDGTLLSGGHQSITANSLSGDGKLLSQGDLTLALQQDFNNRGEISAQGSARISTAGNLSNQGLLQAGQLSLSANNIDNTASGEIASTGTTAINARDTLSNRGLIDGQVTHVQAGTLNNTGSGRIYGDHVAIQAGTINNSAETINGITRSATIAARQRLDIGAGTLNNLDESLIYSGGDAAIGGALDANLLAMGNAKALNNLSAGIDVAGDLDIRSEAVLNERKEVVIEQSSSEQTYTLKPPSWWHNKGNTDNPYRTTNLYRAYTVYYLHPDDIVSDEPYITGDGERIRKAVVKLTPQTSAYFFGRGGLDAHLGERRRVETQDEVVTIYYTERENNQANPDLVVDGADDPFAGLNTDRGERPFRYADDNLTYSNEYGTCATNCVQLRGPADYTDPDAIILNLQGSIGGQDNISGAEVERTATKTTTVDMLASAGPDATIYSGGDMSIATNDLTNRYGQIVAGGDLYVTRLNGSDYAASDWSNIGATLSTTYTFDIVSRGDNRQRKEWSNEPISEVTGQVGGLISAGGTLTVEGGDLSNLDVGRAAPNVRDADALANLRATNTGTVQGPDGNTVNGPGQSAGNTVGRVDGQVDAAGQTRGSDATSISGRPLTQVTNVAGDNPGSVVSVPLDLRAPSNSLFKVQPDAGNYLIETDPRFADYRNWLGSDYLLNALGYNPSNIHKRLGDGYYEQKLVREQIAQLTGRRFLDGYASDEEQYRGLMQSGAAFAQKYGLRPGVALSAAQMAQLTSDIVWLVEQTITLPDGSTTTALVPQLYVRMQPGDLAPSGALLAGENINIKLSGDATNTGTIAGRKLVTLSADNIHNLQGAAISGAQVGLQARQDISITGSTVTASEALSAQAGGDITIQSTLASFDGGNNTQTTIDRVAGLYVTAPEGQGALSVNAGNNLLLAAATINNAGSGNTLVKAGNDLTLATLSEQRSQTRGNIANGGNGYSQSSTTHLGSSISGAGNVVLAAGNDINATAATVNAGNALAVVAGNNLTSSSATDTQNQSSRDVGKKHRYIRDSYDETVQGSSFSAGGDIALQAGNDLTLQSASVISDTGAVNLAAGNNLSLTTTQEQHDLSTRSKSSESGLLSSKKTSTADEVHDSIAIGSSISGNTVGLQAGNDMTITGSQVISDAGTTLLAGGDILVNAGVNTRSERHDKTVSKSGLFSDGGVGFTIGKQSLGNEADIDEVSHTGSVIGSVDGKVNIVAGGDVGIAGSDVIGNGGVNISGENVLITHVDDTLSVEEQQKAKSSGLHISIKGGAADVATSAYQSAKRGSDVEDDRLSALYAAKTAQTLSNGAGSLANASAQASQAVTDAQNGTSTDGGMSLRIGIGGSSSTNTTGYEQASARGSSISSANGNVNIVAREGDLSIIGSQVDGNNVALAAANDLLLQSASQGSDLSEKSKAQSGEIGITLGSEAGIGVYVSASAARGKGQGQGESHAETTVSSRGTTTFVSGNDTTFDGAQLSGERVIGLVGGDFNLTSQQDSNDYERKDVAAGIDAAIGTGGGSVSGYASASKVDSTYTSVNQQTGIQAGSGGYQINVGGHTQLDGAAIASTADPSNNFFSTGSLGYSDLYNEAEYKAQSASVSGGTQGGGSASFTQTDDKVSSITHAGIADGTLIVKDGSGSDIQRGTTQLQQDGLKDIFNQQDVAEQMELMQVAGEVGFTAAGDYAAKQDWKEGSKEKILLHGAVGAAMAALGGGNALTGAAAGSANQVAVGAALDYLGKQGIDPNSAEGKTIIQGVSLAVGAAVGGGEGASVALSATTNNYLTHQQEEALKEALEGCASSGDPQACKESAISTALKQSAANDKAMTAACLGGQESPACDAMVADAKRYAQNKEFYKEITASLDGKTDGYLFNALGYDKWNSGTVAEDARLENDPVAWSFNAIGCGVASIFGGCGSNPPPGSGQIDAVPIPGLEYGGGLALGIARLGGRTAVGLLDDAANSSQRAVRSFADDAKLNSHFEKHGAEFGASSPDDYLDIGRDIVKNGHEVEYLYKGEMRTGYVQYIGNTSRGDAKFAFVGTNDDGVITTIHTQSGKSFWKLLNRSPVDKTIRPKP